MIEATIEANPLQINLAGLKSGNEITKTLFIFPEYILFATISTSREMMLDVSSQNNLEQPAKMICKNCS